MIFRSFFVTAFVALLPIPVSAQQLADRPPVIDVHFHAPMSPGQVEDFWPRLESDLTEMDSLNVRYAVLTGVPDILFAWHE